MTYQRFSVLACVTLVIAGCVGQQSASQPRSDSASNAAAPAKNSSSADGPEPLVAPIIPKGTLIWDGQGISNLPGSIEPPGSWFVYSDKTKGVKKPPSVEEFTTAIENGALHTTGGGYTEWGGGVGTNLVGAAVLTPVDATKYKGFKFKASGSTPMKFLVATVETMPEFGRCKKCYDHYMVLITDLSKEPKTYEFKWSDLKQTGWGDKVKFDAKSVVGLNWTSKDAATWDFTLDDIAFLE